MSKKKDRNLYRSATCKLNKSGYWICKSSKPDIEGAEEETYKRAIESFKNELTDYFVKEWNYTGEILLYEQKNQAKDGTIETISEDAIMLSVEPEDLQIKLVYQIKSGVNHSLSDFDVQVAEV
ncbi:MAG: hypothetical protein BWY45_02557 [Euryarchaeota archaeon ADurb.Bin294]|nr:MAG: hypothetical protein BWY45_02557 [Euryarchaeota archaeon ADurb.Bin294]